MGTEELVVKIFIVWLLSQAVMARVLMGIALVSWADMHLSPDTLGYFVLPTAAICITEAVVSAIVVYPLIATSARR